MSDLQKIMSGTQNTNMKQYKESKLNEQIAVSKQVVFLHKTPQNS